MANIENETITSTTMDASDDDSFVDLMDVDQRKKQTVELTLTPKNSVIGIQSDQTSCLLCATMTACQLQKDKDRTPIDIMVALDVSSSMSTGDKLELCKLTLEQLLRNLLPHDRFGLVTYSDNATVTIPNQLMSNENKKKVLSKIKSLRPYGSTNISAAIALSFQELKAVETPNKVRSIFLLTDGHANRGITKQADLTELTRNCWKDSTDDSYKTEHDTLKIEGHRNVSFPSFFNKKKDPVKKVSTEMKSLTITPSNSNQAESTTDPISLFCFGYGSDHNAPMLRDLADATETGGYYYVQTDSDVGSAFGDAMGGILSIVAQSAVLTLIPPSNGVKILNVYHDRALLRDDTSGIYNVNLGDFYAEETRDVLVEVSLGVPQNEANATVSQLLASLSYTDILKKKPFRMPTPLVCTIDRPMNGDVSAENVYVASQWIRVIATQEMDKAAKMADLGHLSDAKKQLRTMVDKIGQAHHDVQRNDVVHCLRNDLETAINGFDSMSKYRSVGSKFLAHRHQAYRGQRDAPCSAATTTPYPQSHKRAMAENFELNESNK